MPVLDTNFLIALHDGDADAKALLAELATERLIVPSIVVAEFLVPYVDDADDVLSRLRDAFVLEETGPSWAIEAARLRRASGSKRIADTWIAAWAVLHGTFVITRDVKDFAALGVQTRSWG